MKTPLKLTKNFGELSEFTGRQVELFRSSDPHNTAIYFTEVEDKDRETAKAFFELLRFDIEGGEHQIYIRFPNADYFIEMHEGGWGSAHGDMKNAKGENIFAEHSYEIPFTIYSHNLDLLLVIAGGIPQFNFMKKVAELYNGNPFDGCRDKFQSNMPEIEAALKLKYLKLPEDIRNIEYLFKTSDSSNPTYFVVDYPAFNFQYTNHRFRVVQGDVVKEYKIIDFQRFKDGGTTIITVVDENNIEHKFFSPTRFPEKVLCEKWDDTELTSVAEFEKEKIIKQLQIQLMPKIEN